jgi:hypothetical protein
MFSVFTDFENFSVFNPAAHYDDDAAVMFTQPESWARAPKATRH